MRVLAAFLFLGFASETLAECGTLFVRDMVLNVQPLSLIE